jgi:uncharacterized protein YciI
VNKVITSNTGSILVLTTKKNKNMENQNINEKDVKHLQWLYDRMVNVHGENKDYDYMIKFKEIIEQLKK